MSQKAWNLKITCYSEPCASHTKQNDYESHCLWNLGGRVGLHMSVNPIRSSSEFSTENLYFVMTVVWSLIVTVFSTGLIIIINDWSAWVAHRIRPWFFSSFAHLLLYLLFHQIQEGKRLNPLTMCYALNFQLC